MGSLAGCGSEIATKVTLVNYKIADMAQSRACRVWELLVQLWDSVTWHCMHSGKVNFFFFF